MRYSKQQAKSFTFFGDVSGCFADPFSRFSYHFQLFGGSFVLLTCCPTTLRTALQYHGHVRARATRMHARPPSHRPARLRACTPACLLARMHARTHARTQTSTHATHTRTCRRKTIACCHKCKLVHIRTHARTPACPHACTQACLSAILT